MTSFSKSESKWEYFYTKCILRLEYSATMYCGGGRIQLFLLSSLLSSPASLNFQQLAKCFSNTQIHVIKWKAWPAVDSPTFLLLSDLTRQKVKGSVMVRVAGWSPGSLLQRLFPGYRVQSY